MMAKANLNRQNPDDHSLMRDMFKDAKHQRIVLLAVIFIELAVIAGLVIGFTIATIHHQNVLKEMVEDSNRQLMELLSETEFVTEYTIETDNESLNNGYITVNKN